MVIYQRRSVPLLYSVLHDLPLQVPAHLPHKTLLLLFLLFSWLLILLFLLPHYLNLLYRFLQYVLFLRYPAPCVLLFLHWKVLLLLLLREGKFFDVFEALVQVRAQLAQILVKANSGVIRRWVDGKGKILEGRHLRFHFGMFFGCELIFIRKLLNFVLELLNLFFELKIVFFVHLDYFFVFFFEVVVVRLFPFDIWVS